MDTEQFSQRHIGPRESEKEFMLKTLGLSSLDHLIQEAIPENIRLKKPLDLPQAMSEPDLLKHLHNLGQKNQVFKSYIGMGYHESAVPAVIQRNIFENPGWYTSYTPYQAEIAQGRLEALLNFQTMVCELTGMEVANASLLDESTAAAEAMNLLFATRTRNQKKASIRHLFVDQNVLPQTLALLQTRANPQQIELVVGDLSEFEYEDTFFGVFIQYPGKFGNLCPLDQVLNNAKKNAIKTIVAADLMSLAVLESPGYYGADVVVGSTQRFGIPLGYGGPHAAYFATREEYKRNIPGRIIGVTQDASANRALRMALQTREQHIKRDRATSNICTAQVLLAVMAGMYAAYHGPKGLQYIAQQIHHKTTRLNKALKALGIKIHNSFFFDTLHIDFDRKLIEHLALKRAINFNYISDHQLSISLNEVTSETDLENIINLFADALSQPHSINLAPIKAQCQLPIRLIRQTAFMNQTVFNEYHSETALMRYIKNLERKDLSLNHSMIALGSCTMKLNAAAEMLSLSTAQWNNIHPFAPLEQAQGYRYVLDRLESYLNSITGFYATSLQPNSGAQGEYAGLMMIRDYHRSRGEAGRNICLIPSSAHGTNPASAVMAGMKVVVVGTDKHGNINFEELCDKATKYKDSLAALMITYPSTHGVFESSIIDITSHVHHCGGQVYMDGANMNAQVGLTSPARIGADVCHLNLHKTFAIPHGGGGPGVGPICVAQHLSPFLPNHPLVHTGGKLSTTSISAAPWGSALACLISYAYIRMLGAKGLTQSTEMAILNANYIQFRLKKHYQILFKGEKGRAAHEFIIDCRPFKEKGIEIVDIAKRLMDYGFHAPTMSFPVPGTMMIEPTESENLAELNRFCEAMITIRTEITSSASDQKNNILRNAPHTLEMVTANDWRFPYSRSEAAYPLHFISENKFWPSVRRVDEAFGDRNFMCTCEPISSYINE